MANNNKCLELICKRLGQLPTTNVLDGTIDAAIFTEGRTTTVVPTNKPPATTSNNDEATKPLQILTQYIGPPTVPTFESNSQQRPVDTPSAELERLKRIFVQKTEILDRVPDKNGGEGKHSSQIKNNSQTASRQSRRPPVPKGMGRRHNRRPIKTRHDHPETSGPHRQNGKSTNTRGD